MIIRKSKPKELKSRKLKSAAKKPALSYINKLKKIFCQNKKKEYLKKKQDWKNFTLAIKDNTIEDKKKKNNKKCYNC